jgi:hypothetical protein
MAHVADRPALASIAGAIGGLGRERPVGVIVVT